MIETVSPLSPGTRKSISLSTSGYNIAIGYLRTFIVVLVVAHHSVLAYFPLTDYEKMYWASFPVIDNQKWEFSWVIANLNQLFSMQLMFFISGLFLWKDLQKRGSGNYILHRAIRLGVPFFVLAPIIMFVAYYPTWLQTGAPGGVAAFLKQFNSWSVGPLWFIFLLFVFECVATILYMLAPHWGDKLGKMVSGASKRPAIFFASLLIISLLVYLPLMSIFGTQYWVAFFIIFQFPVDILLFYFIWFVAGIAVGAWGIDRGLLAENGNLALRWSLWVIVALVAFLVAIASFKNHWLMVNNTETIYLKIFTTFGFAFSCTALSFAFLAVFVRFAKRRVRAFDSLSNNSYGIFLFHLPIVTWIQYAFLEIELPGFAKFIFVFVLALIVSWSLTAMLRRIPAVRRVI